MNYENFAFCRQMRNLVPSNPQIKDTVGALVLGFALQCCADDVPPYGPYIQNSSPCTITVVARVDSGFPPNSYFGWVHTL